MSDKLLLSVILTVSGTIVGMLIGRYLKTRKIYFDELDNLLFRFTSNLTYALDTVPSVFAGYKSKSSLLDNQIAAALQNMRGGDDKKLPSGFLTKNEYEFACGVLTTLGTYNAVSEKSVAESNRLKLKDYREAADGKYSKLGKSSIKLGFLLGLLIAVLCW